MLQDWFDGSAPRENAVPPNPTPVGSNPGLGLDPVRVQLGLQLGDVAVGSVAFEYSPDDRRLAGLITSLRSLRS
jgi:hypothetical protein